MVDLVTFGETPLRISPPGNERMELATEARLRANGAESNAAVAAAELGSDSRWLSKLPDNAVGHNVERQIASTGVETAVTWTDSDDHRQGITFEESGVEPRERKRWHDRGNAAITTVEPGDLPMDTVQRADVVCSSLSTAVLSDQTLETTEALFRASGGSGAVTALKFDQSFGLATTGEFREAFEALSDQIDLLVAEEQAIRSVLDERGGKRELTNTLSAVYDLQIVVIRLEEGGAVALHDTPGTNVIHERESVNTESIDPSGRADAFTGALLHELIRGADAARSLSAAVAAEAIAETIPGPFFSTTDEEIEAVVERVVENSQ